MSTELPEADGAPVRVRLLGENLVAFRMTAGAIGAIQNRYCLHRGASFFFGRNEEEGIRCVYHGWKFDVTGRCVDMPSEPADSTFKETVCAATYPCVEGNGVVWTYMDPRAPRPPPPTSSRTSSAATARCRRSFASATGCRGWRVTSTSTPVTSGSRTSAP